MKAVTDSRGLWTSSNWGTRRQEEEHNRGGAATRTEYLFTRNTVGSIAKGIIWSLPNLPTAGGHPIILPPHPHVRSWQGWLNFCQQPAAFLSGLPRIKTWCSTHVNILSHTTVIFYHSCANLNNFPIPLPLSRNNKILLDVSFLIKMLFSFPPTLVAWIQFLWKAEGLSSLPENTELSSQVTTVLHLSILFIKKKKKKSCNNIYTSSKKLCYC